ncbi:DUF317 domain-containing protein [Streptomyces huiliensis]|uniref:DUF317 domain-containing protein n=1 Tax=Streptomyces huiliensis TaxID=2876027 RepID=UPI001CBC42BF|nr:hypothetical protein [Streptomyces huiliensis]MBZ4324065.1 hypothetical protein [Streptomyces huiliensis]
MHAADAGDHEALLHDFLASHADWEKVRTGDENTTVVSHESLTLRALFDFDATGRDVKWTFAAYESPVSDLLWHGTATASTPAQIVGTLLNTITSENAWGRGPSTSITETVIAKATRPLSDAGWKHAIDGRRYVTWQAPGTHAAGVQFDAFAAQQPNSPLSAWTLWGGHAAHQPNWALHLSAKASTALLQNLTFKMAHGQGLRPPSRPTRPTLTAAAPLPPNHPSAEQRGTRPLTHEAKGRASPFGGSLQRRLPGFEPRPFGLIGCRSAAPPVKE